MPGFYGPLLFLLWLSPSRVWVHWYVVGQYLYAGFIAYLSMQIFQCVPVEAAWDVRLRPPPLGTGTAECFDGKTFSRIGLFNGGA